MDTPLTPDEQQHIIRGFEILRDFGPNSREFMEYCRLQATKDTLLADSGTAQERRVTAFIREHGPQYIPHG